jgi:hypothetical protein
MVQNNWLPKCSPEHVYHPTIDRIACTDLWRAQCVDCDTSVTAKSKERALKLFQILAQPQTPVITDEMVKAGAAAICCQAGKFGCAAKNENSEFATCVIGTFMQDSRRCLEAALAVTRPHGGGAA